MPSDRTEARVMEKTWLSDTVFRLKLFCPSVAVKALPGQFVNLYPEDGIHLLPRPISLCDTDGQETITLIIAAVGAGTELLSQKETGDQLCVLGPLGNGYDLSRLSEFEAAYMVGGGAGIPPLVYLSRRLRALAPAMPLFAFLGFRERPFMGAEMEAFCHVRYCSDLDPCPPDLFSGHAVSGLLANLEGRDDAWDEGTALSPQTKALVFACGPRPMLQALQHLAALPPYQHRLELQFSMEERMGCGFGACHGCVLRLRRGTETWLENICTQGPVFNGREVCFE